MPKQPPAARWVRQRSVVRMFAQKMAVVPTSVSTGKRSRVEKGLRQVDLNEVPAGPESASGSVRDEKKAIWGGGDCSKKRGAGGRRRWDKSSISREQGNGSISRKRGGRNRKWK